MTLHPCVTHDFCIQIGIRLSSAVHFNSVLLQFISLENINELAPLLLQRPYFQMKMLIYWDPALLQANNENLMELCCVYSFSILDGKHSKPKIQSHRCKLNNLNSCDCTWSNQVWSSCQPIDMLYPVVPRQVSRFCGFLISLVWE